MLGSSVSIAKAPIKIEAGDQEHMAYSLAEGIVNKDLPKECEDVGLDDTQKTQIADAYFDFKKQKNTLEADIKNALMDLSKTMMSATSTKDEATADSDALKGKMMDFANARSEFDLKVFYDILKPEQRAPAFKCIAKKMKKVAEEKLRKACKNLPPEKDLIQL
jgi:hypothetical protein